MLKVSHKCFDCISRRSRWKVSIRMGAKEAWRVVIVGQNCRCDCKKSSYWSAVLRPGSKSDTVSLCGCMPCHAEDARWEKTSRRIPSRRISNCCVSSESSNDIQSTRAFATNIGCTSQNLTFHFCVLYVISRDAGPFSTSDALNIAGSPWTECCCSHVWLRLLMASTTDGPQLAGNHTYRVFIKLIDPNHSLNLARAPPCFSGWPLWDPFPPAVLSLTLHSTLTRPLAALRTSLSRLGRLREAVLRSSR